MHSFENMECLESALNTGAFVSAGGNVMTASWGLVGVMWGRKVYVAPIRDSRYTKELLDRTGEFTVSVPAAGSMKKELAFCGTKSGRDCDKREATGMEKQPAREAGGRGGGGGGGGGGPGPGGAAPAAAGAATEQADSRFRMVFIQTPPLPRSQTAL